MMPVILVSVEVLPIKGKRIGIVLETPLQHPSVASAVVTFDGSCAPTITGIENEGYESKLSNGEDFNESERMNYMCQLANTICVRTLPTQINSGDDM
jgi:hypothetical protein